MSALLITVICLAVTACGASTGSSSSTGARQRVTHHHGRHAQVQHPRRRFPKYAGLGASAADFKHDNRMFCLSCSLLPGEAAYSIKGKRGGRVTEYDVTEDFKPAASAAVRLSLVAGTMIPGPPAAPVRHSANCTDYRVPRLKKLIGVEYAEASTSPGVNFATMQAVATPGCT